MKKLFYLLLITGFLFAFTACGGGAYQEADESDTTEETSTDATEEEATEEEDDEEESEEESSDESQN